MCAEIATIIRGKHCRTYKRGAYTSHDKVIVVNASNTLFTGRKLKFKNLKYHTGKPSGLKEKQYKNLINQKPELLIFNCVYKFLPKNRMRFNFLDNLSIYAGRR
jgi:large subunit ribosomal protein L13